MSGTIRGVGRSLPDTGRPASVGLRVLPKRRYGWSLNRTKHPLHRGPARNRPDRIRCREIALRDWQTRHLHLLRGRRRQSGRQLSGRAMAHQFLYERIP